MNVVKGVGCKCECVLGIGIGVGVGYMSGYALCTN